MRILPAHHLLEDPGEARAERTKPAQGYDASLADRCPASRSSAEGRRLTAVEWVHPALRLGSHNRLGVGHLRRARWGQISLTFLEPGRGAPGEDHPRAGVGRDQLTIHADRGSPMITTPVTRLLAGLVVTKSRSRPSTSYESLYVERQFRILKYLPTSRRPSGSSEANPSGVLHLRGRVARGLLHELRPTSFVERDEASSRECSGCLRHLSISAALLQMCQPESTRCRRK